MLDNFCIWRVIKLNLCKIDKSNKKLLELRSRSTKEQKKLHDTVRKKAKDQEETQTVRVTQLNKRCSKIHKIASLTGENCKEFDWMIM